MIAQQTLTFDTAGRNVLDITHEIYPLVRRSGINTGLCNIFIQHTSASLIICENADPQVLVDLEAFMKRLVPDGDPLFRHRDEGADDMPAHVRTVLTQASLTIPVLESRLALGTWQGIFLWEHRTASHTRTITITLQGE